MIEIIDNMERAIQSASANKDFDNLVKGIEMTLNQAHSVFKSEGVEPLEAKGKEFNPMRSIAGAGGAGMTLLSCIGLGIWGGLKCDEYLGTYPFGLIGLSLLGAISGLWAIIRKMIGK